MTLSPPPDLRLFPVLSVRSANRGALRSHFTQSLSFPSDHQPLSSGQADVAFSSVQSLSRVRLFATPWTAARQASLSVTNSRILLRLMCIESVMPSNHLILCHPLLLLPSILPSIRVWCCLQPLSFLGPWCQYSRHCNCAGIPQGCQIRLSELKHRLYSHCAFFWGGVIKEKSRE